MNSQFQEAVALLKQSIDKGIKYVSWVARERAKMNKDTVIAICGYEGLGKSTLAIILGILCDPRFDLVKNMLYSPTKEEVKLKVEDKSIRVIIADEAIKILYKLNWRNRANIFLNMLWALCRKENKITILCMPRFGDFQEYFRHHRIMIWIQIIEVDQETNTGYAVVFRRDWSPFAIKDPWWIDDNQRKLRQMRGRKKFVDFGLEKKLQMLSRSDNYVTLIKFPKLPLPIEEEYLKHKNAVKYEDENEEDMYTNREQKQREDMARLILILKEHGYNIKQISAQLDRSEDSIYEILRKYEENRS